MRMFSGRIYELEKKGEGGERRWNGKSQEWSCMRATMFHKLDWAIGERERKRGGGGEEGGCVNFQSAKSLGTFREREREREKEPVSREKSSLSSVGLRRVCYRKKSREC